jgi:hypothetical protein
MSMDELDPIITDETLRQRIRQLVETPKSDKTTRVAQTLRHPLTGLVFGFLLTGVVGSIVAAGVQQRADKARFDQEIREARRASALTTVDTVGFLLNRTYYLFGEYWDAIKRRDLPRTERETRYEQPFHRARAEFESRRFVDAARVQVHFGPQLRTEYERIADSLQYIVGNFSVAVLDRNAIAGFSPSVQRLKSLVSQFLLRMVQAADSISTTR